jgi:hypothetical protein
MLGSADFGEVIELAVGDFGEDAHRSDIHIIYHLVRFEPKMT